MLSVVAESIRERIISTCKRCLYTLLVLNDVQMFAYIECVEVTLIDNARKSSSGRRREQGRRDLVL